MATYSQDFFTLHLQHSISSAEGVIPVVMEYVRPSSVIDIGCGIGTWLKVWKEKGVADFKGVDGSYVKVEQLLIPGENFETADLSKKFSLPRKFDLVSSLEVGEHIDASSSDAFVETLCGLGDLVLFSAAIPGQEGTHHINEQYPDYWAAIFEKKGFVAVDCLRQRIWDDSKISWWYRQNVVFFVRKETLSNYPALQREYERTQGSIMRLVHPDLLDIRTKQINNFRKNVANPLRAFAFSVKRIIQK